MPEETPKALAAFERYWAMGPVRSLRQLVENDISQSVTECSPDSHLVRLKEWSSTHGWQARVKARVIEEAEAMREQLRERALRFRETVLGGIEVDVSRYIKRLRAREGEVLAEDAAALDKMTKLYYQLAEQPLADRHELTGKGGGPVEMAWWAGVEQARVKENGDTDGDGDEPDTP